MYCPKCYKINDDDSEFCKSCGHRLKGKGGKNNQISGKHCVHCGNELAAGAVFCSKCGHAVSGNYGNTYGTAEQDVPSVGLNILAFLIPLLGLILFCVYHNKTPKKAAAIGKWALIRVGVNIIFLILFFVCGALGFYS